MGRHRRDRFAFRWKKQWGSRRYRCFAFLWHESQPYLPFNLISGPAPYPRIQRKSIRHLWMGVLTLDDILFKFEALFQTGDLQRFGAVAMGVEKTFGAVFHTACGCYCIGRGHLRQS